MGAVKQKALLYGNGNTYLKNICWIRQLYDIVGVTDSKHEASCKEEGIYKVEDAVGLTFDIILVTSVFFDEIKNTLAEKFCVDETKIFWFLDEFSNERHETFGEKNPDITFYVFRAHWQEHKNGFYNFFARAIASCYKARQMGYELVVDMKNYYTEYAGLERYGAVNVWEDYYEQPSRYTLDDVYQSKNVVLSRFDDEGYNYPKLSPSEYLSNKWYSEVYEKLGKMFRFTPSRMLQKNIDEEMERLNMSGKIFGVLARGTDYITLKPKDHPIPFDIELLIAECQRIVTWGGIHIFIWRQKIWIFWRSFKMLSGKGFCIPNK